MEQYRKDKENTSADFQFLIYLGQSTSANLFNRQDLGNICLIKAMHVLKVNNFNLDCNAIDIYIDKLGDIVINEQMRLRKIAVQEGLPMIRILEKQKGILSRFWRYVKNYTKEHIDEAWGFIEKHWDKCLKLMYIIHSFQEENARHQRVMGEIKHR